jgi:hypothetical protein
MYVKRTHHRTCRASQMQKKKQGRGLAFEFVVLLSPDSESRGGNGVRSAPGETFLPRPGLHSGPIS